MTNVACFKEAFLSYSKEDKETADTLDAMMKARGMTVIRDERDLHVGDSVGRFMQTGRNTDRMILVISHTYLTSLSCLNEVLEAMQADDFQGRIRPLILKSANIFTPEGRSTYVRYWDQRYQELEQEIRGISPEAAVELIRDLARVDQIRRKIGSFLLQISDRYSCTSVPQFVSNFA